MKTTLASALLALVATSAVAQENGDVSVALGLSTLGGNIEAAYTVDPSTRVRGIFIGGANVDYDETDDDNNIEGSFELGGFGVLADYYPYQGGWRVSGGLFFSTSEISATGTAEIEGVGTESVTVSSTFANELAPMITTGYDWRFADDWSLSAEAGVIVIGGVDIDFEATDSTVQDAVDDDPELRDAQDEAGDLNLFPYIGLTASYHF